MLANLRISCYYIKAFKKAGGDLPGVCDKHLIYHLDGPLKPYWLMNVLCEGRIYNGSR